jgi:hypothetical protein
MRIEPILILEVEARITSEMSTDFVTRGEKAWKNPLMCMETFFVTTDFRRSVVTKYFWIWYTHLRGFKDFIAINAA